MKMMCAMCREVKDETQFRYMKHKKRFCSYCKECEKIYNKAYGKYRREKAKEV